MREVKVSYAKIPNMGDLLNELIIEDVLGYKVVHSNRYQCETTAIGSGLNAFFPTKAELPSKSKLILNKLYKPFEPPLQIWSTGFITHSEEEHICLRKEINVAAVRGELTRKRLEKILNTKLNIPTGDGGLLASYLIKEPIEKKYAIGIIPHFKEKDDARFQQLLNNYKNSVLIDLTEDPLQVVKMISECEVIISSSLHGFIVADSFGIPNKRLVYSNKLMGDGYKFKDYYSAFNLTVEPFDLNNPEFPTINDIIDDYKISPKDVEKKKNELIESFSKYL